MSSEITVVAPVRRVAVYQPLRWLERGWRDFLSAGWPSGFHGLVVATGGLLILVAALQFWPLAPGAFSGFVLIGPILATGLYDISRRLAAGQTPHLGQVIRTWKRGTRPLVWLGVLLAVAGTLWVLASALLFGLFVKTAITGPVSFLRYAVAEQSTLLFALWLTLGGLGAALVFAATAVSAPMLLDRDVDVRTAVLTSVRAVGDNPGAMGVWAAIIMLGTVLGMATAMLGFIVVVPVIGHATWHAYRDLVDHAGLAPRR
jgi:uncharacterized membrane protein